MLRGRRKPKDAGAGRVVKSSKQRLKAEMDKLEEDRKAILMEMLDPYWSFRFMRANG
jgi:hypothetical protein